MSAIAFTLLWNVGLATVLAILLGLLSRSKLLRHQPGLTHALWLLVLVKLITPPLIPLPVLPNLQAENPDKGSQLKPFDANIVGYEPSLIEPEKIEGGLAASSRSATNASSWSIPWLAILIGVSGCGTLILITSSVMQLMRVSRILRRAASGDVRLSGLAQTAACRMGMRGIPVVCAVDAAITPLLWVRPTGPVIVMPTSLAERLSDEQITCIFCHELAHYVRRDHWSIAFAFLVAALFWWHPVAWWARREMRAAQEVCCDGLVLATGAAARRCYAETLFQALEFVQTHRPFHPSLVSGLGSSSSLQRRFEMIASLNVSRRFSWGAAAFVIACASAALCFPVRGQSQTAADEARLSAEDDTAAKEGQEPQKQEQREQQGQGQQGQGVLDSGRNSKDYRLAEKEADRLVALLETFGHEEIYIWAYDRENGMTSITASARDHQLIEGLIQLLTKERQLSPKKAGSGWDNRKKGLKEGARDESRLSPLDEARLSDGTSATKTTKRESREESEARIKAETDAIKKAQQEADAQIKAIREELKRLEKLRPRDEKAGKNEDIVWRRLGFALDPIDAGQLRRLNPQLRGGLIIIGVRPESPAEKLGLREGDVMIGLDKWETLSLTNVQWVLDRSELRDGQPIRILTLRDDETRAGTIHTNPE